MGGGNALKNVLFRLVIPTILFSTLIYLPKVFFHKGDMAISDYFFYVFGGISYWFTSALVVAQLCLLLLLLFKKSSIWFYVLATALLFAVGSYLSASREANDAAAFFPWYYSTGFVYTFIMALGGVYYRYEAHIDRVVKYALPAIAVVYVWLMYSTWDVHSLKLLGLGGHSNFLGFVGIVCGTALLVAFSKMLRPVKSLEFIGRNSIVFYFFSGAMPAVFGTIARRVVADDLYIVTLSVAILSFLSSYLFTWVIVRYMPFITDLRKLKS